VREVIELLHDVPNMDDIRIGRVCLGLGYTGVKLESGQMGVCHSLLSEMAPACCEIIEQAGTLAGRPVPALLSLADSWDLGERVIGIATMNALSQIVFKNHPDRYALEERNLIDVLEIGRDDAVVLVGLIKPFIPILRSKAKQLCILERGFQREKGILPDTACEEVIPEADVVVITGSSLANGTIDRLLELAENARTVALVGPTVSCVPDPLFKRGVSFVGGIRIFDPDKAMQIIGEGGGTPQLKQAAKFVTYRSK
jgi:uncharacterized protein (DUF4213/DUF364 family)